MPNTDLEVLSYTLQWLTQGQRVALVTIVSTHGEAPRSPGALLAISQQGDIVGSVSGGCIEDDLVARVTKDGFNQVTLLQYGANDKPISSIQLPCGGGITVVLEPLTQEEAVKPAVLALQQRQLVVRQLDISSGQVTWPTVVPETAVQYDDGRQLTCVFGPQWQLLIIGAGQISRYLAEFALALNYQVLVCDPRVEYTSTWSVAGVTVRSDMPDDAVNSLIQDSRSAVVTLTHDSKLDDLALLEALNSPAFYIGALGSKTTSLNRRTRLRQMGLTDEALTRLHAPVGLPIGGKNPAEIALSILAEMTATKYLNPLPPTLLNAPNS